LSRARGAAAVGLARDWSISSPGVGMPWHPTFLHDWDIQDMTRTALASLAAVALAGGLAAGCAGGEATVGDAIQGESDRLAVIGADWTEGDELVQEGRENIEEGREMIERGREMIEQGEDQVAEGKAQRQEAERAYRQRTGRPLPVSAN
jgi:hypothetical protein